jgi:hypothetical protein
MKKLPRWSTHNNLLVALVLSGYVVLAFGLSGIFHFPLRLGIYSGSLLLAVGAVAMVYFVTVSVTTIGIHKPSRPIAFLWSRLVGVHRVPQWVMMGLPVVLLLPLFFSAFTSVKSAIGIINPYSWERTLMGLDAHIHGGTAPCIWLQVAASPLLTFGLAFFTICGSSS